MSSSDLTVQRTRPRCQVCGRTSRRACGLFEHTGRCGLPDPRWRDLSGLLGAAAPPEQRNPMHQMSAARAALAQLTHCGAHSRRTGQPCRNPPCRGSRRCRMHGGKASGAPVTSGKRTLRAQRMQHWLRLLVNVLRATQQPMAPQLVAQDADGVWRPAEIDVHNGMRSTGKAAKGLSR